MFVIGNVLEALAQLISVVGQLYVFILIGRVICSWVNADPYNPIVRFILMASDPVVIRIRRFVPPIAGLDFSLVIAIVLVQVVIQGFLVQTLLDLARKLA